MRKPVVGAVAGVLLVGLLSLPAVAEREPEGCQVFNPVQPTCKYTVTHVGGSPVSGFSGMGTWVAKIKRGKKKITVKSPGSGQPPVVEFAFEEGDVVTLTATSPGSGAIAGHVD